MEQIKHALSPDRKREIDDLVLFELQQVGLCTLPLDVLALIRFHGWYLLNYTHALEDGILEYTTGFSGTSFLAEGQHIIVYNERESRQRQRWTIAHEAGHVLLDHRKQSKTNEMEANYFAKQLLTPLPHLFARGATDAEAIAKLCDVSKQVAGYREREMVRFCKRNQQKAYSNFHEWMYYKQFL